MAGAEFVENRRRDGHCAGERGRQLQLADAPEQGWRGPQYRSAILAHSGAQAATARAVIAALRVQCVFADPIVTEVIPLRRFWSAEPYHRRYSERHPGQPRCRAVVGPKVATFRQRFAHRLRGV